MPRQATHWAERVRERLEAIDRTQAWLARRVDINEAQFSRLMNGHPDYKLSDDRKRRIAEILEVPVHWLFGDEDLAA